MLYYYGARYYNPRTSQWLGIDPYILAKEYWGNKPKDLINNGVFRSKNLSPYSYAWQNPIILRDPDGRAITPETAWDIINVVMGAASFAGNVATGNVFGAVVDGIGLIYDGAATVVPVLPGGG